MTKSIWLEEPVGPREERPLEQADVAIIGGGVIGAGCAYYLSQKGLKVTVVDSGKVASGATGRSAGFVLRGIQIYYNLAVKRYGREIARTVFHFAEENQGLIKDFVEKHGNSFEYNRCGSYLLACSLEELEELSASAGLMKEDGFEVEYLKDDPLDRDYYGALYNPGDVAINPVKFVQALLAQSKATVYEEEAVLRVKGEADKLRVLCARRTIECSKVILATNAYTPLLEPSFTDKIQPARGQILVTQPLKKTVVERLCYANYGWEYFRQLPDKRLLLGGCRQLFPQEEQGFADMVTRPVQSALENILKDRFADIAGVRIDYRWSGTMAFTQDGLPLVGELKRQPGVYFAVAFNGHGLGYGLNMSRLLVDIATDGNSAGVFAAERAGLATKLSAVGP